MREIPFYSPLLILPILCQNLIDVALKNSAIALRNVIVPVQLPGNLRKQPESL